ncbi:esterase [Pseudozyma hubeiensis SY62]|uniref:Esterase n=1 Tax=Pseudozyma hubeiensis (strain SY62) TaxID=1305764 RepID=R9PA66_PSEHS|nr:esterase [Pseudozyma hubeiensis SY62]GAC94975.1 esterase [Pseudozyma hubeiensis SY62]
MALDSMTSKRGNRNTTMTSSEFPAALRGTLQLYQPKPVALPYFDTDATLPHTLVFIPGLTDTLSTLPYLPQLASLAHSYGFSLVQPQLTCNLGGYGQCTLEGDAQEIAACVAHLRSTKQKSAGKVVLMGHSTGCQDVIAYLLSSSRAAANHTKVDGAILQAPVSDREFYEMKRESASPEERKRMDTELELATRLVKEGRGSSLMPREPVTLPTDLNDPEHPHSDAVDRPGTELDIAGNASAVLSPAMTAYRTWSLKAKGGHDDFFSSDLDNSDITNNRPGARTIGRAVKNLQSSYPKAQLLALIGEKEQTVDLAPTLDRIARTDNCLRGENTQGGQPSSCESSRDREFAQLGRRISVTF